MSWTDLLANKLAIQSVYGTSLLLSDLEVSSVELDLDRDSVFLRIRTGKMPIPVPNRWSKHSSNVSFKLRAQLLNQVDLKYPFDGETTALEIHKEKTGVLVSVSIAKISLHLDAGYLTIQDLAPF
jgi:hypothetical protein